MSKTKSAKPDTNVSFRTSIGGQALIEGILMRGPTKQAIVCRTQDGMVEKVEELHLVKEKHPILGWPLIRGVVVFLDSMVKGMKALTYSADLLPEDEQEEPGKIDLWIEKHFGEEKAKDIIKRDVLPWFFLVPAIISFAMFKYYPILLGFFVSFFKVDIVNLPGTFIGFDNYIRAFQDKEFLNAVLNTFQFLAISLLINFWVPIFLATLINEVRRGKTFMRTMYFIPAVAPGIAMNVLWKYIWQPDYGLANYLLKVLGLPTQKWLNDPMLVKWCMQFPGLVIGGGLTMVIYLAALQSIPKERYEAAELDGAGLWARFRYITMPSLRPTTFYVMVNMIIGSFNVFIQVMMLTGGNPNGKTSTLQYLLYDKAFNQFAFGEASAIGMISAVTIVILTVILNRTLKLNSTEQEG